MPSLPLFNDRRGDGSMVPNTSKCPVPRVLRRALRGCVASVLSPAPAQAACARCVGQEALRTAPANASPPSAETATAECISDEALIHLKSYKYSSVDKSPVSKYILGPWVRCPRAAATAEAPPSRERAPAELDEAQCADLRLSSGMPLSSFCRYGSPRTWSPCWASSSSWPTLGCWSSTCQTWWDR